MIRRHVLFVACLGAVVLATEPRDAESHDTGMPKGPPGVVDLTVHRTQEPNATTYHYVMWNRSAETLLNFMVGHTLSSDSCPELQVLPVGFNAESVMCPSSIVTPKPWKGCVSFQEECAGLFLAFDYPEGFHGLGAGDSLAFSATVATPDSTYEQASFWVVSNPWEYEGRVRKVRAPGP